MSQNRDNFGNDDTNADLNGADLNGADWDGGDLNGVDWRLEPAGAAAPFPSEDEWLHLPLPEFLAAASDGPRRDEPKIGTDFVARTLAALVADRREHGTRRPDEPEPRLGLTREQLFRFAPDEPSADFVSRTVERLQVDRRARWHELLARHVAPEPSPFFVQRTLAALALDALAGDALAGNTLAGNTPKDARRRRRAGDLGAGSRWLSGSRRFWSAVPLLAAAAAVLWFFWTPATDAAPLELKVALQVPVEYTHADSATPLPAMLAQLAQAEDANALPTGTADGLWLAQAVGR